MFAWLNVTAIFASLMNISTKDGFSLSSGRIRLMTRTFSKPSTPCDLARYTSAIPPRASRSRS